MEVKASEAPQSRAAQHNIQACDEIVSRVDIDFHCDNTKFVKYYARGPRLERERRGGRERLRAGARKRCDSSPYYSNDYNAKRDVPALISMKRSNASEGLTEK